MIESVEITEATIKAMLERIHGPVSIYVYDNQYKGYNVVKILQDSTDKVIYRYVIDFKKNLMKAIISCLIVGALERDDRPECIRFMKNL